MKQKYKNNSVVYNCYFDWTVCEIVCDKLTVERYDYMDGMQWHIIDEYKLTKEIEEPFLKFFKKKKKHTIKAPGCLISSNKHYAKLLLVSEVVRLYGYALETDTPLVGEVTLKSTKVAKKELDNFKKLYPELIFKSLGEFKPEESSGLLWR